MVLRQFSTSSLEALCAEEHLELLDSVDTLRSQGISHYISLPQIIVCGDQSSGKSSVLEAISGVSFPVKSNLCTRFPTELVLRKSPNIGVKVSIVPHRSRSHVEQDTLSRFHEELESFEGLPTLIENAKAAMGIFTYGKAFSNDLLRVEVSGPDRPHLTIVDLPGLIHSETKLQSAADVALVQDVVQSYMKEPRSIILAVVSAKNDFANQIVLRLARQADPAGHRTLGVITKPDTLVEGSESERQFVLLAKNEEVTFRLGWHVLKNMDTEKGNYNLSVRGEEEAEFFSRGIWEDLPRSHVGIDTLRQRLSKLLLGQIAAELPSLIDEIQSKMDLCVKGLEKLGEPRATLKEQRSYLLHISQCFQTLVRSGLDGSYSSSFFESAHSENGYHKRMRAVIQNLNEDFAQDINKNGHYRQICKINDPLPASDAQLFVSREEYLQHIERLLRRTRGRELPGTFNPMIINDLFKEQSEPWQRIANFHVTKVWEATKTFIYAAVAEVSDMATLGALLKDVVEPALSDLLQSMEARLTELLERHQAGHAITYNHSFTEDLQRARRDIMEDRFSNVLTDFFDVPQITTSTNTYYNNNSNNRNGGNNQQPQQPGQQPCGNPQPQQPGQQPYGDDYYYNSNKKKDKNRDFNLRKLLDSLLESTETDMIRYAAREALDCTLAYYKVALKRFIDGVATDVVETTLTKSLTQLLSPMLVHHMPDTSVSRIAGESKENRDLREQLSKKLEILESGSKTCRKFVNIQGITTPSSDTRHLSDLDFPVGSGNQPPSNQLPNNQPPNNQPPNNQPPNNQGEDPAPGPDVGYVDSALSPVEGKTTTKTLVKGKGKKFKKSKKATSSMLSEEQPNPF
ncbi:P-loop containing nucleoside triphosphate hydrolase protein [Aspergillus novoparasiticus]|uniref:P-loop containing nucleoside triphosphate hydrolase protein n=1 Tax=Aspergillus novoparasiticus TaxID=986946 RepID=A0A5N6F1H3_9EURO|nr:P-loop containing nucleoside triphosphate hydrolase protein [Aspergillus novoparasiticus]